MLTDIKKIVSYLIKEVHLPEFIENTSQAQIRWLRGDESAVCNCPMSWHKDRNASFHINRMEDGAWVYHCFGCHSKGHIVKFFMDYTGEKDYDKAVKLICEKLNIKSIENFNDSSYENTVRRINKRKELETTNILVSNQCRLLLRKDFNKNKLWVANAYKRLNKALDEENKEEIEKVGYEASKMM